VATWNDLFDAALMEINALEAGGTGATADRTFCLGHLNRMLSSWSAELGPLHYETTESLTWASGQASRTIGTGGDLNTARPEAILAAQYRDTSNADHDLDIITHQGYQAIINKTLSTTEPRAIAYNPTIASGYGTLFIWPIPSSSLTFRLTSRKPFTAISDQTATVVLPSGYEGAIVFNLALRIASGFGKVPTDITRSEAIKAKKALVLANIVQQPARQDPLAPGQGSGYDARAHWVLDP
jgi:hypothetical protein